MKSKWLSIALGVHPACVAQLSKSESNEVLNLAEFATQHGAIAIGECGLDARAPDLDAQEVMFRFQLGVARELRLPLILHVVKAHDRALAVLQREPLSEAGGVLHSYSGSAEQVTAYARFGLYFSFAGPVTYPGAKKPLRAAQAVPSDRLLIETDSPDQAPEPYRGSRCEPSYLPKIAEALAQLRGESPERLALQLDHNAVRLFGATLRET